MRAEADAGSIERNSRHPTLGLRRSSSKLSAGGEWVHSLDRGLDGTHQGPWWTKGTRQYHVPTRTAVQAQVLCKPSLPL